MARTTRTAAADAAASATETAVVAAIAAPTPARSLADVLPQLVAPFPPEQVEVKPGAVARDGKSALALAYADWRLYAERLDEAAGPANWSIQLIPWGDHRVIARLTIFGISKDSTGEGDPQDENCGTIAEAQAKKRACAEFGLGRYFYHLPRLWGKGEGDRRSFSFDKGEPQRLVYQMYAQAGLIAPSAHAVREEPPAEAPAPRRAAPPPAMPAPVNTADEARARVAEIRGRATSPAAPADPARAASAPSGARMITERQLQLLADRDQLANATAQFGVARLEDLTFQQASALIGALSTAPRPATPRRAAYAAR